MRRSSLSLRPSARCDLFARRSAHWRHTFRPLPGALGHLHVPDACGRLRGGRAQTLFGMIGTLIVIVVFVVFGAPAAGGSVARPFLPSFWGTIGPYLPPGAGTTAVRNTIYFDGNGIGKSLIVLAAYLVAGAGRRLRNPSDTAGDRRGDRHRDGRRRRSGRGLSVEGQLVEFGSRALAPTRLMGRRRR
jgi:hypothetical protein